MKRLIDAMLDRFAQRFSKPSPALEPVLAPGEPIWAAGDVAECISSGPWHMENGLIGTGPLYLEVRRVDRVEIAAHAHTGQLVQFLVFARYGTRTFEAIAFRKIEPRPDSPIPAAAAWINRQHQLHSPLESEMS